jgi:hypothetical protein
MPIVGAYTQGKRQVLGATYLVKRTLPSLQSCMER